MNISQAVVEGWTDAEYKSFRTTDDTSSTSSGFETDEEEEEPSTIRGFVRRQYKKIVSLEELLPE